MSDTHADPEPEFSIPYLLFTTTYADDDVEKDPLNIKPNQALKICRDYRGDFTAYSTDSGKVPPTIVEASNLNERNSVGERRMSANTVATLVTKDGETVIEAPHHFITDSDSVLWYKDVPPSVTHRRRPSYNPVLPTFFSKSNTRSLLEDLRGKRGYESSKSGTETVPNGK